MPADGSMSVVERLNAFCDERDSAVRKLDARRPLTFQDIIRRWIDVGPVERAPTGWATFDEAARGGLAFGRITVIAGAPNAGKTAIAAVLAERYWRAGHVVGLYTVDEDPDDLTARFCQMVGVPLEATESGDAEQLADALERLSGEGVVLFDATWSIEEASAELARVANGRRAVLVCDSIQTIRSVAGEGAKSKNEKASANVLALRMVKATHRFMVIVTSEMPRGAYRSSAQAAEFNDMAAGKDSGDIEYAAAVQLVCRSVKDHPGLIHVNVPKLKRGKEVEFHLRLNRVTHSLVEADAPMGVCPDTPPKAQTRAKEDAITLRQIVLRKPGIGERELRGEWGALGLGVGRLLAAKAILGGELHAGERIPGKPQCGIQYRIVMGVSGVSDTVSGHT